MLLFEVKKQMLKRLDAVEPATDSQQYLKAKFTVNDADWNGKVKTAYFRLGDAVYKAILNSNNECVVPFEVLIRNESKYARTQGSKIFVSLVGEYGTVRITTNEVQVDLNASGYADAEEPKKPTESEYQQILTQYANNEAAINKTNADLVGVKNNLANAIKGNLSGAVVFADDVSPVEHNPVVKVHGKNVLPYPFKEGTTTNSGVTFTDNGDGSISLSGVSTNYAVILLNNSLTLEDGKTYELNIETDKDYLFMSYRDESGIEKWLSNNAAQGLVWNSAYTFENIYLQIPPNEVVNLTITPSLRYAVEPSTVTVTRCGKQVFAGKEYELAKEYAWSSILIAKIFCGSGNYVASCNFKQKGDISRVALSVRDYDDTTDTLKHVDTTDASGVLTAPFVVEEGKKGFQVFLYSNYSADDLSTNCLFENIQVEVGTESTPYQPYNATTYTPSADGTVEGITSLSPNMTILTDTEGAIVECEYIKDTNKLLKQLEEIIVPSIKISSVTLYADQWEGASSPYSQKVDIAGATINSKINLNPTIEQLNIFYNKDISFVVENDDGNITVYCIGQKPTNDYTMQATVMGVLIDG